MSRCQHVNAEAQALKRCPLAAHQSLSLDLRACEELSESCRIRGVMSKWRWESGNWHKILNPGAEDNRILPCQEFEMLSGRSTKRKTACCISGTIKAHLIGEWLVYAKTDVIGPADHLALMFER